MAARLCLLVALLFAMHYGDSSLSLHDSCVVRPWIASTSIALWSEPAELEARLSLTAAPSGLMPRVEQLEQTFGVTTAGSVPERLTALEAVADSWGI